MPVIVLLFVLWLLLSGEVTVRVCVSGAVVSCLVYAACRKVLGRPGRLLTVGKLGGLLRYLGRLVWEMLKAGFVVMGLIYRGGRMEPVLVRFRTELKSDAARAMLADSITLTAGTITACTEDGEVLVHALDRSLAEGIERSVFAARLEKLEE